jgi:hypothetical protein
MRSPASTCLLRIVDAYDGGEGSIRELIERFAVNPGTVQRIRSAAPYCKARRSALSQSSSTR